jgi:prepilin peptidase CpaA
MNPSAVVALGVGLVACVTDVRTRRIPNWLTFGAAATAIVVHTALGGSTGAMTSVAGWAIGAALFMPFFLFGGMGAGDVKLLAALGAWLGPRDALWLAIYAALAGGVAAVVVACAHGYLRTALRNVLNLLTFWVLVGPRPMPRLTLDQAPQGPRLAYAIPIFLGTVATIWLR